MQLTKNGYLLAAPWIAAALALGLLAAPAPAFADEVAEQDSLEQLVVQDDAQLPSQDDASPCQTKGDDELALAQAADSADNELSPSPSEASPDADALAADTSVTVEPDVNPDDASAGDATQATDGEPASDPATSEENATLATDEEDPYLASTVVEEGEAPDAIFGSQESEVPGAGSATQAQDELQATAEAPLASAANPAQEQPLAATNSWVNQNGSYYYYENGIRKTGWLVGSVTPQGTRGELQRYWLDSTGRLATSRLVPASEAGWWAYAQPMGIIVRGKWTDPSTGYVYLANNDGVLENPGWVVTNRYGDDLQRYYVDARAHACVPGYSTDGWNHYTTNQGYVFRGVSTTKGSMRMADNDGRMVEGWIVTTKFGQGLQRYWQSKGTVVSSQLVKVGSNTWTYARPEGYVVRGQYVNPGNGFIYFADNDGKLIRTGWVVTNAFSGGLQRYYINPKSHAAEPGFFSAPLPYSPSRTGWFYAEPNLGYVARGKQQKSAGILLADNEGTLAESFYPAGWMVTTKYDAGEIQRYWLHSSGGHLYAKTGFFTVDGKSYYGIAGQGYVHRGKLSTTHGILLANNDGHLAESTHGAGWMITTEYAGTIQRYYLTSASGHLYAKTGFFNVGGASYYGIAGEGYVHRGKLPTASGILLANNDGKLAESSHAAGWMITAEYDGILQRYYLQRVSGHLYAKVGFFRMNDRSYYGIPDQGYVLRNATVTYRGSTCTANNDGVMRYKDGTFVRVSTKAAGAPLRILMLGNSFTYYNNDLLATTLTSLLGAQVTTSTHSGATLADHLNASTEVGSKSMPALTTDGWDYVIVQEVSTNPIDAPNSYYQDLQSIVRLAHQHGATPVIYGTWAYAGDGNETSRKGAGATWRGISLGTMNSRLQSAFTTAASRNDISVANVGKAFADRSYASSLYDIDKKHPSAAGSRLAAQVIANTIKQLQRTA